MSDFVDVLLAKCDEALVRVEDTYRRDIASHTLSDDLLYDIRSVVQDCQSALDATATKVEAKHIGKSRGGPYFPLAQQPADFLRLLNDNLKGLTTSHPQIAAAFERHQPYQPGKTELGYLHKLARVNKHSDFSEQNRTEQQGRVTVARNSGMVSYDSRMVRFGQGVSTLGTPVNPATQLPNPAPGVSVTVEVLVGWNFVDPPIPVLPTLTAIVRQTEAAVADVSHEAGL